ncbi:LysR substrate-binding domain-containing protein [Salinisphaera sp. RV14]|uniref:LysR substrate-binding domain-containing protein n=1 Tax=Salinisphaera sp. RV14 TaxID=3454140 RepID=UPI003F877343
MLNTKHRSLDIELLRTFHMASALGTLRAVAEQRHFTLGAVSQQIKRLEAQLGRQLLIRSKTGVQLTPEGAQLQAESAALVSAHDALLDRLLNRSASGLVRLGCPEEYAPALLNRLLPALRSSYPAIRLHVRTATSGELERAVAQGALELAIVIGREGDAASTGIPLWKTRPVWAGAAPRSTPYGETLPLALHPEDCPYRGLGLAALDAAGRSWETVFASGSVAAIESAVASGLAISVLDQRRLTTGMRELGASEGLPTLPDCLARLVEIPPISGADTAVKIVKERVQDIGLNGIWHQIDKIA